jgi:hypothetical protein
LLAIFTGPKDRIDAVDVCRDGDEVAEFDTGPGMEDPVEGANVFVSKSAVAGGISIDGADTAIGRGAIAAILSFMVLLEDGRK